MKHKSEIVQAIYEGIFRNEIFYLAVGCAFLLVCEWLKVRVFPDREHGLCTPR